MSNPLMSSLRIRIVFLGLMVASGLTYGAIRLSGMQSEMAETPIAPPPTCLTIATDPNPPLNVRSSPIVAPDNIIGKLGNGTVLTVIDKNQGWLRISTPIAGWVYQDLTVTSCTATFLPAGPTITPSRSDQEQQLLNRATEEYHRGNLQRAITLAKTIPRSNAIYPQAQSTIVQWQWDWHRAEKRFSIAQAASKQGKWQDVLAEVKDFPDNRYWRSRLSVLVREAVKHHSP